VLLINPKTQNNDKRNQKHSNLQNGN